MAGWVAVGIGAVGASVVAARWAGHHLPACALREATGVACPACGLTRVAVAVGRADPLAALAADPAAVALLALVVVAALAQVLATVGRVEAGWLRSRALPVALVGLLAAHWATTLVTGGLPPS